MKSTTIARMALRGTVWSTIGNYLSQLIGFIALLLLTRQLSPEVFGTLSLASFWVGLLQIRNKLGLSFAAVRHPQLSGELLCTFTFLDASSALLSILITSSVAFSLAARQIYTSEVIFVMLVMACAEQLTALAGPFGMALEKEMQVSRTVLVSLVASVIGYSSAILLAFAGAGIWSLLAITLINYTISVLGTYLTVWQRLPHLFQEGWRIDHKLAIELLSQGVATGFATTILAVIVSQFDNFLIGTFVSKETLGFYDRAFRIASWPNNVLTMIIMRVGYLTMAKVKDDRALLTHTVRLSLWLLSSLGVPIGLSLLFGAYDFILLLYGERWVESAFFLRFLACSALAGSFLTVSFWLAVAVGDRRQTLFLAIAQSVLLLIVGSLFTWLWGAVGTVIAVCVAMSVGLWVANHYLFQQVDLTAKAVFGVPLLASGLVCIVMSLVTNLPSWSARSTLQHAVFVPAIVFTLYLGTLYLLDRQEMSVRLNYLMKTWNSG